MIYNNLKETVGECLGLTQEQIDEVVLKEVFPRIKIEPISQVIGDVVNKESTTPEMRLFLMFLMGKFLERDFLMARVMDVFSGKVEAPPK